MGRSAMWGDGSHLKADDLSLRKTTLSTSHQAVSANRPQVMNYPDDIFEYRKRLISLANLTKLKDTRCDANAYKRSERRPPLETHENRHQELR